MEDEKAVVGRNLGEDININILLCTARYVGFKGRLASLFRGKSLHRTTNGRTQLK